MQFFRSLLGLVMLSLVACSNSQAPKSIVISGDNPAKGLIVVGVAIDRYDTIFGMTAYGTVATLELGWARWDAGKSAPSPFSGSDHIHLQLESCGVGLTMKLLSPSGKDCDLRKMQYYVLEANPGNYRLSYINHSSGNFHYTTAMTDGDQLMTRIGAGEIVYIGDFTIDAYASPQKIIRYGRNDDGARQAVAEYPNVRGEVVFRKPSAIP